MYQMLSKNGLPVFVTTCPDCGENENGLFCQVYDSDMIDNEIDYFTITAEELCEKSEQELIAEYLMDTEYKYEN